MAFGRFLYYNEIAFISQRGCIRAMMQHGFLRVCCATPQVKVADPAHNAAQLISLAQEAARRGALVVCFPELCLSAYTCGDLFLSKRLQTGVTQALADLLRATAPLDLVLVVGLPLSFGDQLYNCAAVLQRGKILGLVPKQNIPNYGEFYEARIFSPGRGCRDVELLGQTVPFGEDLLFCCNSFPDLVLGVEICEDLWVADSPSNRLSSLGATLIANPSASDEVVGKAAYRRQLLCAQSAKTLTAYLYTDAGAGESSQDLVFSGHNLIYENGSLLAESQRFTTGPLFADVDLSRLRSERQRTSTFRGEQGGRRVFFDLPLLPLQLERPVAKYPFVPEQASERAERCEEILRMQAAGLATRLSHVGARCAVVGLSGGLDSTLALVVACHAFDLLGLPREGILAVTMPCFGTTGRTRRNAELLAKAYGVSFREVDILASVRQHFQDIGQSEEDHSVAYENAQARERTQVLMDLANQRGGLVIGTGDLSELALGWATYNGDHMSMYGVNASIPKTLVRHLVSFEAGRSPDALAACLRDILDTPVSPELLPPKDGDIAQRTEDIVGPYALHDFFLYYLLRFSMEPEKILYLAQHAFGQEYDPSVIRRWLATFLRRFFSQAFKRSCLPDGPKVGSVALSPRGDWRMPSDASARLWLEQLLD